MKILFISFALLLLVPALSAEDSPEYPEDKTGNCATGSVSIEPVNTRTLGGPEQVDNRLDIDSNQVTAMFPSDFAGGYFDWKERIKDKGLRGIVWVDIGISG